MDQNFHLIEKYFQGKLDKDELQLFNEKLQQDPSFEQEFRDMKLIRDAVKESSRVRALNILQNAEANHTNQETTKINVSMKRLVSIAASLIIVATVSYFAFSGGTGALTGEEIFSAYYEPYTNIVEIRERDPKSPEITTLRARAYNAYDIKDYSTSANLFKDLLASEKAAENYLYSGIANLEAGNLDMAKNNLNTVMNNFSVLGEQAQWFLAMTLFKEGSDDEAVINLAQLSVSNASYKLEAEKILKALKFDLNTESDGHVGQETTVPAGSGNTNPNGVLEIRRYQFGEIISLDKRKKYTFFNEEPIDGLKVGDLVTFVSMKGQGNKEIAFILANHK